MKTSSFFDEISARKQKILKIFLVNIFNVLKHKAVEILLEITSSKKIQEIGRYIYTGKQRLIVWQAGKEVTMNQIEAL